MDKKRYIAIIIIIFLLTINIPSISSSNLLSVKKEIDNNESEEKTIDDYKEAEDIKENILLNNKETKKYVPGELIIKFKENNVFLKSKTIKEDDILGIQSIDTLNDKYKVKSCNKFYNSNLENIFSNLYLFELNKKSDIMAIAEEYKKDPNVEFAEPNYIYTLDETTNDPLFEQQWGLNQINDFDIDAPEAWNINKGSSNVTIAILDTGVDYNHPDLADNIWNNENEIPDNKKDDDNNGYVDDIRGWDFVHTTISVSPGEDGWIRDNDPMDFNGHGTHCSGIASAVTNNSIGIAGVCWNAKIMPVRVGYTSEEEVGQIDSAAASLGIHYAADNGADVLSMSFGGPIPSYLMHNSLEYAYEKGVVLVSSAGNDNTDKKKYPAGYEEVISVAATNQYDYRAYFSNYGNWVDIAAPGVDINSTYPNDTYRLASGTSMACPHVAGLAGLILSKNNSINPERVKTILEYSVDRLDINNLPIRRGRINAYKALQRGIGDIKSIINKPNHCSEVKEIIEIKGTAIGTGFQNYTIQYCKGKETNKTEWNKIFESNKTKENEKLFSLNTETLKDGLYTILLRVNSKDGIYDDAIWLIVNNKVNTFKVDDDPGDDIDYNLIQQAINNAGTGDSIYVYNGTYNENLKIYKTINLEGCSKENTTINGQDDDAVYISADNVNISGFRINGSSIYRGVFFYRANNNNLYNNNVTDCWVGIKLSYSKNNTIKNNVIFGNLWTGLLLTRFSNRNRIIQNNFITIMPIIYIHAYFRNSWFNKWQNNYWDDWVGHHINLLKLKPKRIPGKIFDLWPDTNPPLLEDFFHFKITLRSNRDWNPAKEPFKL